MNTYNLSPENNNLNFLGSDKLIHNIYVGDQTVLKLKQAEKELLQLTAQLRSKGKPVLILTDISKLGNLHISARIYSVDFIKHIDFDKVAIFGNSVMAERVVNVIITASGRGYKMKYFSNEQLAKDWLRTN